MAEFEDVSSVLQAFSNAKIHGAVTSVASCAQHILNIKR